jgi:hypothetical protein
VLKVNGKGRGAAHAPSCVTARMQIHSESKQEREGKVRKYPCVSPPPSLALAVCGLCLSTAVVTIIVSSEAFFSLELLNPLPMHTRGLPFRASPISSLTGSWWVGR